MTTPAQTETAGVVDVSGIPAGVLAVVDTDCPEGHPSRPGVLRDLAAFYASGGFRADRYDRIAPIVRADPATHAA